MEYLQGHAGPWEALHKVERLTPLGGGSAARSNPLQDRTSRSRRERKTRHPRFGGAEMSDVSTNALMLAAGAVVGLTTYGRTRLDVDTPGANQTTHRNGAPDLRAARTPLYVDTPDAVMPAAGAVVGPTTYRSGAPDLHAGRTRPDVDTPGRACLACIVMVLILCFTVQTSPRSPPRWAGHGRREAARGLWRSRRNPLIPLSADSRS
jgi:hypothetical protein